MPNVVRIDGRTVRVELTAAARASLQKRTTPLLAEMELYFSCLVRMKVRFHEHAASDDHVIAAENLAVRFRPVMTKACHISDFDDEPPVTEFPIRNPAAFVPHWLRIDFRHGCWSGEFGYRRNAAKHAA